MRNKIIPYNPNLKFLARKLRKEGTLAEIILWKFIRNNQKGFEFHRQVPIDNYIVDFYCHELRLAIEIDGISHEGKGKYDEIRELKLESLGVSILRFSDESIKKDLENVLLAIEEALMTFTSP